MTTIGRTHRDGTVWGTDAPVVYAAQAAFLLPSVQLGTCSIPRLLGVPVEAGVDVG